MQVQLLVKQMLVDYILIVVGVGGFKATPGSGDLFVHTIANDQPHKLNEAFNLNRFIRWRSC